MLLITLFAGALVAPGIDVALRPSAIADVRREMRTPATFPDLPKTLGDVRELPSAVDAWWADRMGLRDVLLERRSRLYVELFHRSPTPAAVLGRSNWVFPTLMGILDASRGTAKLPEKRLALWQHALESRRDFCESLGAEYVAVFAPEKPTIYPDFLPSYLDVRPPTAYDQLLARLERHSDFRVLDIRPLMFEERGRDHGDDFAYYPLGTHWTDRAIYSAYELVVARLAGRFPNLAATPLAALHWKDDPDEGDTWAFNLRLVGRLHQHAPVLQEIEQYDCEVGRPGADDGHLVVRGPDPTRPKLVLFHDSFGDRMRKLFARDFSECYFSWGTFEPEIVERERPDVVIELRAERQVLLDRPAPIVRPGHDPLGREFEQSREVLFRLDLDRTPIGIQGVDGAVLEPAADGLVARLAANSAGTFEVAGLPFAKGRGCIVRMDLEAEKTDLVDVLFLTQRVPRFRRGQVVTATLPAGRSVVYAEIDEPDLVGALRFRFGRRLRSTLVHALEVRAKLE